MVLKFVLAFSILALISCTSNEVKQEKVVFVIPDGEKLFQQNCASCHGCDGTLGMSGATDLSTSTLSFNEMKFIIEKGKGTMPRFREMLSKKGEMDAVVEFVQTLNKTK